MSPLRFCVKVGLWADPISLYIHIKIRSRKKVELSAGNRQGVTNDCYLLPVWQSTSTVFPYRVNRTHCQGNVCRQDTLRFLQGAPACSLRLLHNSPFGLRQVPAFAARLHLATEYSLPSCACTHMPMQCCLSVCPFSYSPAVLTYYICAGTLARLSL